MQNKSIVRIALVTGCILLVPLLGNLFMGWNWPPLAFALWGAVLFGTGLTYELIARKGSTIAYRAAVGIACPTGFVLVFINAAAGIIGDGPVNVMYLGVLAVGFLGAFFARLQPRGTALALFATAVAQCWSLSSRSRCGKPAGNICSLILARKDQSAGGAHQSDWQENESMSQRRMDAEHQRPYGLSGRFVG